MRILEPTFKVREGLLEIDPVSRTAKHSPSTIGMNWLLRWHLALYKRKPHSYVAEMIGLVETQAPLRSTKSVKPLSLRVLKRYCNHHIGRVGTQSRSTNLVLRHFGQRLHFQLGLLYLRG